MAEKIPTDKESNSNQSTYNIKRPISMMAEKESNRESYKRRPMPFEPGFERQLAFEFDRAFQLGPSLDPYAANIFREALEEGYEIDRSIRVNIVGNFRQGKTSLVHRLIGKNPHETFSTNGISVTRYKCQQATDGKISYMERTSPGQTSSEYINRIVATQSEAGNRMKQEKVKHSESTATVNRRHRHYLQGISRAEIVLLNKTAKELREKKESPELKSNESIDFDIWDFGGQHIFYATHMLFHSTKAVYILVYNISLPLNEVVPDKQEEGWLNTDTHTMEYFLRFWVNSVHSFVGSETEDEWRPPIILVGTHRDKLDGDEEAKKRLSEEKLDEVRKLFQDQQTFNHIVPQDFAVDNRSMPSDCFSDIRGTILQLGHKTAQDRIPTKWIQLEMALSKITADIVTLQEIKRINQDLDYPLDFEQFGLFLKYHHDKGTLFHFDENPIADFVVLNPQYLIDAFKCIITPQRFQRNAPKLQTYWKRLREEAKLEIPLINEVWTQAEGKQFMKYKDIILLFLNKHLIISEALKYDEETGTCTPLGWYIVPSMLRDHISAEEISKFLHEKNQTKIRYILKFDNSAIVPTIYHRLIAACLGKWSTASYQNKKLMYNNLTVLRLDKVYAGLIEMNEDMIELSVVTPTNDYQIDGEIADYFRRFVETVVLFEFRKHQGMTMQRHTSYQPYQVWYKCTHSDHDLQRSFVSRPITELDNEDKVTCPDNLPHLIKAESAKGEWFQGNSVLNIPNIELPIQVLSRIATCIGNNWEFLALDLKLATVDIDQIKLDNPNNTVKQIYCMLQKWNQQETATMLRLVPIMQKRQEVNINWDEIRNIVGEINAEANEKCI